MPKKINASVSKKSSSVKKIVRSKPAIKKINAPAVAKKSSTRKKSTTPKEKAIESFLETVSQEPGLLPEITEVPREEAAPEIRNYIAIPTIDPEEARKRKVAWTIVCIFGIGLFGFWGWMIKNDLSKPLSTPDFSAISDKTTEAINNLKETLVSQTADAATSTDVAEIEKVKSEVLQKLQLSLDSSNWPSHTSAVLGLSINYPTEWYKKETTSSFKLSTASSTDPSSSITIFKIANTKNLSLTNWIAKNKTVTAGYQEDKNVTEIGNQPALGFIASSTDQTVKNLFLVEGNKNIYKIEVSNNQPNNQIIIDNILSSIIFNLKPIK